jgi:hypothetical protein
MTLALLLVTAASAARAQVPAGPEFRVNEGTVGPQHSPDVAFQPDGGFVVVWSDPSDGSLFAVRARRYDAAGAPVGSPFQVNTYTTGSQQVYNSVRNLVADDRGRFVVAWTSTGQDGSGDGVFARRLDSTGAPLGPEFRINAYTTSDQETVALAVSADGSFLATWNSFDQDGSLSGIFARRFDPTGAPLGDEFQVNQFTTSGQLAPAVARVANGFVIAWMSAQDGSSNSVHARRYDGAGGPVGNEFRVNTTTLLGQTFPVVAPTPSGFVVAWESDGQDGSADGIYAQRFDGAGGFLGAEFRVNTYTTGRQAFPSITTDRIGGFAIGWASLDQDGSGYGAYGQRFDAVGVARGQEFRVNGTTAGSQTAVRAASDPYGNLLIAWDGPDGQDVGAFAQRYGGLRPAGMSVTDGANGVLEVPEDFALITSWRNVNGAAQTFQGASSAAVVPPGLFLTLGPLANYGTVPDGSVGACGGPCFSGGLTGTRPAGHVDLSFLETIQPDAHGQQKRWLVHLGDSFTDVPRANPFYRFVETLLHHGVTAGCGPGSYCPASSTTREGMAVFVLVAKEGEGYAPPACTTPIFNDVPAGNPFCRWIEELARRGVVGGCGGGNYCPSAAVTREQMAVFVLRTLDPTFTPPPCVPPNTFNDVSEGSAFCPWIEELARRGVVGGCGGGNFCPAAAVSREQMGVFISLTFGLGLYGP